MRERILTADHRVRRVPDHLQVRVSCGRKDVRCLGCCADVAGMLVFETNDEIGRFGLFGQVRNRTDDVIEAALGSGRAPVGEDAHDLRVHKLRNLEA